jgi:hypothetical protein
MYVPECGEEWYWEAAAEKVGQYNRRMKKPHKKSFAIEFTKYH